MIARFISCWFLLSLANSLVAAPKTVSEQLSQDNPRVIAYLQALTAEQKNKTLPGVRLSDGTMELKGAIFLGSRYISAKKQHLYLFREDGSYRAYVWIDAGGRSLAIPADKSDDSGENAMVLSGDVFTFTEVSPKDGLVVLFGATPAWLQNL